MVQDTDLPKLRSDVIAGIGNRVESVGPHHPPSQFWIVTNILTAGDRRFE